MFSLRDFVKKGFLDAIGKMANYQIILNAAGWQEKGVLTESDLSEINDAIDSYVPEEASQPGMMCRCQSLSHERKNFWKESLNG